MEAYFVGGVFFIWLLVLTVVFFKLRNHYYHLISTTKKDRLDDILDSLIEHDGQINHEIESVKKKMEAEIAASKLHLQKIGLVRFNPFESRGGEQSFVISMLDIENSGIILNFIYTREGLRVYTKRVKKGRGVEYELSGEEEKAIEKSS